MGVILPPELGAEQRAPGTPHTLQLLSQGQQPFAEVTLHYCSVCRTRSLCQGKEMGVRGRSCPETLEKYMFAGLHWGL